jgi:hypothetical protein
MVTSPDVGTTLSGTPPHRPNEMPSLFSSRAEMVLPIRLQLIAAAVAERPVNWTKCTMASLLMTQEYSPFELLVYRERQATFPCTPTLRHPSSLQRFLPYGDEPGRRKLISPTAWLTRDHIQMTLARDWSRLVDLSFFPT